MKFSVFPLPSWIRPVPMMTKRARSLAYVNTSCTAVAHLTSQQLTNVRMAAMN